MTAIDYVWSRRRPSADQAAPRPKFRFPNPFNTLKVVFEKDLAMLFFYCTMVYLVFILICATLSTQLASIYPKLSDLEIGLCYLPCSFPLWVLLPLLMKRLFKA